MMQGYYTGVSGVMTHQYGMDIVSDNLANVNTVGFRGVTGEFADLFTNTLTSAGKTPTTNDIGVGSRLQATSMITQNGSLLSTDRFGDLAISGDGWFGVMTGENRYFTRAGNFVFDETQTTTQDPNSSIARLVTTEGMYLTGTMLANFSYNAAQPYDATDGAFVINTVANDVALGDVNTQGLLELPSRLVYPTEATATARFYGNLGVENVERTMSANAISPNNDQNRVKLVFTQSATQPAEGISWDITATVTSADGSVLYDTQTGNASFNQSGALESFTLPPLDNDGAPVAVDLGSAFGGIISSAGPATSIASQSDGVSGGTLTGYAVNENGIIVADFSNGRQSAIGRVAVYHFQNEQGLERTSGTLFAQSANSGEPMFYTDANGNAITGTTLRSGYLENSNVRLDVGLTDMIIMQRAYQANAKTITTVDEMIQKALSMRK